MLDKISSALQAVGRFIREQWKEAKEEEQMIQEQYQKQQDVVRKQQLKKCIYQMMQKMAYDLFEVFQYQRYPRLLPIRTVSDIRLQSCQVLCNTIYYKFRIDKSNDEQLLNCEIQKILNDMNTDIRTHRVRLAHMYGHNMHQYFPFLARGIRVVAVKDLGLDVEIIVETVISPEEFYEEYRQIPYYFTDI